jgi:hypothetical protein
MDAYLMPPGAVRMSQWNVIKICDLGTMHIAGFDLVIRSWRISTEIMEINLEKLTAKTFSGSTYSFTEPRGEMHPLVVKVLDASAQGRYRVLDGEMLRALIHKPIRKTGE